MRTVLLAAFLAVVPMAALAEDVAVHKLVAKDGVFEPATIEVPAGKRFKLEVSNEGKGPMEFESKDLKQEKIIAKGGKASFTVNALKPGTYVFFDEHHQDAPKGKVIVK